jgi:hypothetical protein
LEEITSTSRNVELVRRPTSTRITSLVGRIYRIGDYGSACPEILFRYSVCDSVSFFVDGLADAWRVADRLFDCVNSKVNSVPTGSQFAGNAGFSGAWQTGKDDENGW